MRSPSSAKVHFSDLAGRTLLVTGVTRGIGRAFLPLLLDQGLHLVLVSRGKKELGELKAELGKDRSRIRIFECDLGDPAAVAATAREIAKAGAPLDAILHNAGVDPRQRFEHADQAFWLRVLQVNLLSGVTLVRHLLPLLRKSTYGRVLFTGSVMADLGGAYLTAYAASKAALVGTTRALAHELKGSAITVNCVIPGAIQVEKEKGSAEVDALVIDCQSVPRRLVPNDLFGLVALLLSRAGGAITGQAITVDGGILHPIADPKSQQALLPAETIRRPLWSRRRVIQAVPGHQ